MIENSFISQLFDSAVRGSAFIYLASIFGAISDVLVN